MTTDKRTSLKRSVRYYGCAILIMGNGVAKLLETYHKDASLSYSGAVIAAIGIGGAIILGRNVDAQINGLQD